MASNLAFSANTMSTFLLCTVGLIVVWARTAALELCVQTVDLLLTCLFAVRLDRH